MCCSLKTCLVDVEKNPGAEGDLDALPNALNLGSLDVLLDLGRLFVHVVTDVGAGGAPDYGSDKQADNRVASRILDQRRRRSAGADGRTLLGSAPLGAS